MPSLGYWKNKGLAQPIRLLLTYAGVEFEDVQYGQGPPPDFSRESWYSVKPKFGEFLSFPNLPYYIDGDVKISQSHAIVRHVARKYKLDGETEKEKAVVDMIIEEAMDLRNNIYKITYTSVENYEKLKPDFFKNLPPKLKQFENHLGVNDWFAMDAITAADFSMYDLLDFLRRLQSDCLNAFPKLQSFLERFESLPKVKEYLSLDKVKNLPRSSKIAVRTF
ncbi:glutathione S-transferase Mu 1-like [Ruditapes philippinarum]|uniref:glutathione S-transferase Mu 1-like n=1 Tax=Ruditapes philippinarum TaxID=129788 RepID=UPI00295BF884|nr:glutathione S-transferase Mu 1-like [Ruditapes philippinarum]